MQIKLVNELCKPVKHHPTDAGWDLFSTETHIIKPGESCMIDTGVATKIPVGYVGLIFNRSSQGKIKVQINNAVGVIDSDYRGTIKVLLTNNGVENYQIFALNTRVAQLLVVPIHLCELEVFAGSDAEWLDTARGVGGFGSTGV